MVISLKLLVAYWKLTFLSRIFTTRPLELLFVFLVHSRSAHLVMFPIQRIDRLSISFGVRFCSLINVWTLQRIHNSFYYFIIYLQKNWIRYWVMRHRARFIYSHVHNSEPAIINFMKLKIKFQLVFTKVYFEKIRFRYFERKSDILTAPDPFRHFCIPAAHQKRP